ncbi:MAG: SCP2 sterol-binding domain-containing protein [Lysobacteraceae bacterium]
MNAEPVALPSLVKSTLGRLLGGVLDRIVRLDPGFAEQLAPLQGRRLEFHLTAPPLAFAATWQDGRFQIGPVPQSGEGDLSLSASLGALLSQLLPGRETTATVGRMRISGDAELARRLQQLVQRYDPDVEGLFVSTFGEVLGVQLAQGLKQALGGLRNAGKAAARDGAQFLTEESRDLVARAELEAFCDDVDDLRDAVERLERKLQRRSGSV